MPTTPADHAEPYRLWPEPYRLRPPRIRRRTRRVVVRIVKVPDPLDYVSLHVTKTKLKADGVEVKARWMEERRVVTPESLVEQVRQMMGEFQPPDSPSTSARHTMRS